MKIAILSDFPLHLLEALREKFRPKGHFATWLPQLVNIFEEYRDLEVHWITMSSDIQKPLVHSWKSQTFHILPTQQKGRAPSLFANDRKAIRACISEIRPDLVHGWGTEDVYALAAVASGLPHIISMQGILSYYMFRNRMNPRSYLQAMIELYVLWKAECITTESEWGKKAVLRRNPRAHVELVEYGVQHQFLDAQWNPDPQKPAALFVGSVTPRKGIQDAVAAFQSESLAHAELWVAGSGGEWAEKLKNTSSSNVKWLGRVNPADVVQKLCRAWCLVLPTRADTSPNVVKEARVIGLPVVSTPHGGQTAYIQPGENGYLVEPGDIEGLTKSLRELLADLEKTKAMGQVHHQTHRQLLDPRRTAEGFYHLYKQRLSHRQTTG